MLEILLANCVILPAAVLCYLPMRNRLKYSVWKTIAIITPLLALSILSISYLEYALHLQDNDLLLPILLLSFLAFHFSLRTPFIKSISTFSVTTALMAILSNLSTILGSLSGIAPDTGSYSVNYSLIQICLNLLAVMILLFPFRKYGKQIIDQTSSYKDWTSIILFSVGQILICLVIRPIEFLLLAEQKEVRALLFLNLLLLFSWLLTLVIFYFSVFETLRSTQMESRARILEMQEKQYASLQRYIRVSEKTRHDFRHSVRTMTELCDAGDMEGLREYLHQYVQSMPASEVTIFCNNSAVNALLNYYMHIASQNQIDLLLRIDVPDELPVSNVDLCDMIGNILENAIVACQGTEERFIHFTMLAEDGVQLYIVSVNSFNGKVRQKNGVYLSTSRKGAGIGLSSIASTAESYGGMAQFSHEGDRFYCNVAIPLN